MNKINYKLVVVYTVCSTLIIAALRDFAFLKNVALIRFVESNNYNVRTTSVEANMQLSALVNFISLLSLSALFISLLASLIVSRYIKAHWINSFIAFVLALILIVFNFFNMRAVNLILNPILHLLKGVNYEMALIINGCFLLTLGIIVLKWVVSHSSQTGASS